MRLFFSFFLILNVAFASDTEVVPLATLVKTEFIYPDFTHCYEKNRQSIVYFGNIRAVAMSESKAESFFTKTKHRETNLLVDRNDFRFFVTLKC